MSDFLQKISYYEIQATLAAATIVLSLILIFWKDLFQSNLERRVAELYSERERLRKRDSDRLKKIQGSLSDSMRATPIFERLVAAFNLVKRSDDEEIALPLRRAGYRGRAPVVVYLAAQLLFPPLFFIITFAYLNLVAKERLGLFVILAISFLVAYFCRRLPDVYLKNKTIKRQAEIFKFWPDMLDILLLSIQAGMSIEAAFRTVSQEIGVESPVVSEEIMLTLAELSYLQNRVQAYRNLERRVDLDLVRAVVTVLVQSERYGTSMAQGLRTLAQDGRNSRMAAAEKKAAALPPRLTVPMIVFFLPVLFVVIMTPAIFQILQIVN